MLKNVQESQNPLFKNSIKMEKQEKTCCFHLFRISKLLKLETRDLHSLKDLFKSFPMVIYFSYFEENEEWFLKALRSASFFLNDLVLQSIFLAVIDQAWAIHTFSQQSQSQYNSAKYWCNTNTMQFNIFQY